MKKIILLIPLVLLSSGCTNQKEKLFEKYAKEYYENHMKMIDNIDTVTITIKDLINVSKEDKYDLKELEKCDSSSKITFYINEEKNIENYEIELSC